MRSGTPLARLRERQRREMRPERRQASQERRLEARAEDAHETKLGNRPFEIVNVQGTDVAPFLGKTDGEKLVDPTGLDDEVVVTAALSETSIRPAAPATNAAQVLVAGLNSVGGDVDAAGASTVITATFSLDVERTVTIRFSASFSFTNAETCEMAMFVDFSGTHSMANIRAMEGTDPSRYREVVTHDPAGGSASVIMLADLTLAAGEHEILVLAMSKLEPSEVVFEPGSATIEVFVR
jgi:hypothetical protein